eukprot:CAMPEP_0118660198 /NCGR_PEP_ID=MMETSP0785-20121206/15540_1 /TAXON_ID=91992 /ORGANISM="Bolidomonas pacifica, Strain CCMP 1866" /LENGTH=202 /DNA_ID=CAMNT_0006553399 /DNA_START=32 /DNA_END=637 /DNA_ORIENTATION=+
MSDASNGLTNLPKPTSFSVCVAKEDFKFNLAHFVAYEGFRERLHGHNYSLSITLLSPNPLLESDGYVVDFGVVKKSVRAVCKSLNERVIVPTKSDVIKIFSFIENDAPHTRLECEDKSVFVFPTSDCFMAPIVHSTVEEISLYMYGRIVEGIGEEYLRERNVREMLIKISEAPGQSAEMRLAVLPNFSRALWEESGFNGLLK